MVHRNLIAAAQELRDFVRGEALEVQGRVVLHLRQHLAQLIEVYSQLAEGMRLVASLSYGVQRTHYRNLPVVNLRNGASLLVEN